MRRLAVLLILALTPACKKDAAKDNQAPAPDVKPDPQVEVSTSAAVYMDDLKLGDIDAGKAGTYPPIQGMLPPEFASLETWASVEVKGLKGLAQKLISPAKTHPGEVAALFTMSGGVAFGFFAPEDLAKKGKPKLLIPSVVEVRVHTADSEPNEGGNDVGEGGQGGGDGAGGGDEGGERPTPTGDLKIHIKVGGTDTVFDGTQLAKLESTTAPVGDTETQGWTIPAVLKAAGVDVKKLKGKVVLYGDEGANLILEASDLQGDAVAFIKLNRQGKLRFRLFRKAGTTWDVAGELRGIASIESK